MGWFQSKWFKRSGDTPKFKVGQLVYFPTEILVSNFDSVKTIVEYLPHTIACIEKRKSGIFFREFTYKIERQSDRMIVQNVYESEIFETKPNKEDN